MNQAQTKFANADEGFTTATVIPFNPHFKSYQPRNDNTVSDDVLLYSIVRGLESFKTSYGLSNFNSVLDPNQDALTSKLGTKTVEFLNSVLKSNDVLPYPASSTEAFKGTLFSGAPFNNPGTQKKGILFVDDSFDARDFQTEYNSSATTQLFEMSPEVYAREKWRKFSEPGNGGDAEIRVRKLALYAEALYRSHLNVEPTLSGPLDVLATAPNFGVDKILMMIESAIDITDERFREVAIQASLYAAGNSIPFARVLEVGIKELRIELLPHLTAAAFGF